MKATFHPQAWVNDHAIDVDPEGETSWVVTPEFYNELRVSLRWPDEIDETNTYESDYLRHDPAAPQWVRDWHGPFYVEVHR